jgi:hypothetical protein
LLNNVLKRLLTIGLLMAFLGAQAQKVPVYPDSTNKKRLAAVLGTAGGLYAASVTMLYFAWYKGYSRTRFHIADDWGEWMMKDKMGHFTTTYQVGNYGYWSMRWAGLSEKKAIWYGGTWGLIYMTTIEFYDGLSAEWGFSPSDMAFNTLGSAMFISQQLLWHEQRFRLKFSYHPTHFAQYRPDLLGSTWSQRIIKDYNGETNWLSLNIASFLKKESKFPSWFNVAFGYSARGLLGAYSNPPEYKGRPLPSYRRTPQFFLSLDVDLTKIKTHSKVLKFIFKALSFIKIPAPAIEYNPENGFVFHAIYF